MKLIIPPNFIEGEGVKIIPFGVYEEIQGNQQVR